MIALVIVPSQRNAKCERREISSRISACIESSLSTPYEIVDSLQADFSGRLWHKSEAAK